MSFARANGQSIETMELTLPIRDAWDAALAISGAAPAEGATVVIEAPGGRFVGTALRPGTDGSGKATLRVRGGAGRLRAIVGPSSQTVTTVRDVARRIVDEAGERLSTAIDAALLGRALPRWVRPRCDAAAALDELADALGIVWRVLDDGTVWLGTDAGVVVEPDHDLTHEEPREGLLEVGIETLDLRPGQTFRGGPVGEVVYRLDGTSLRATILRGAARASRSIDSRVDRKIAKTRRHPPTKAKVVSQNADGTLELVVDSPDMPSLSKVPIRHGLGPGVTEIRMAAGASAAVFFEGGDPQRPFVALFSGGRVERLAWDVDRFEVGGAEAVALAGLTDNRFAALEQRVAALEAWGPGVTPPFPGGPGAPGDSVASEALFSR